jgi:hypothetical protein
MKTFYITLATAILFLIGCSNPLLAPKQSVSNSTTAAVHSIESASPKTAVQTVVSNASHILIVSGVLAVIAGAALIYFGRVVLGVEMVAGGITVPIAAIWLLHYYVWVILGTVAVLVITHWAIIKPYVLPLFQKVESIVEPKAETTVSGSIQVK